MTLSAPRSIGVSAARAMLTKLASFTGFVGFVSFEQQNAINAAINDEHPAPHLGKSDDLAETLDTLAIAFIDKVCPGTFTLTWTPRHGAPMTLEATVIPDSETQPDSE